MNLEEAIKLHAVLSEGALHDIKYYTILNDMEWLDDCKKEYEQFAEEERQLAEWLRELKAYREAVKEIKEYASIWMEWNEGMSKHEIAEKAMTDAKEGFIAIVEKHLKEVNADEDSN